MTPPGHFILAAALALLAGAATAETWRIDRDASRIAFSYLENGETIEGVFTEFDGEAEFDDPDLSDASVIVEIETGSVSFGDPLRDHFARGVDWFDAENHPAASFTLTELIPREEGGHSAIGLLEIRGVRREVAANVTIRRDDGALSAIGEMTFPRSDFGVGVGFSAMMAEIGDEVTVSFDLAGERVD